MKHIKKKLLIVLSALVVFTTMMAGCGQSFDASKYLQAILDNSYKNDPSGILEQKIGTKEEANAIYEEGIQNNVDIVTAEIPLTEESEARLRDLFCQVYANSKYTVGEAEKQDDDSYLVTVTYQPVSIMSDSETIFEEKVTELTNDISDRVASGEEISEEEINTLVVDAYIDCLNDAMNSFTYGEESSMQVRVAKNSDNVYEPDSSDLETLENAILSLQ